jgi:hypothetical protein
MGGARRQIDRDFFEAHLIHECENGTRPALKFSSPKQKNSIDSLKTNLRKITARNMTMRARKPRRNVSLSRWRCLRRGYTPLL